MNSTTAPRAGCVMKIDLRGCVGWHSLAIVASTVLFSGCTGLPPPHVEIPNIYVLDARPIATAAPVQRNLVVAVSLPRARPGFDTPQMVYVRQPHTVDYFVTHRWADTPSRMLGPLLAQALEQTRSFNAVVQTPGGVPADLRLDTELIRLQHDFGTQPSRVELTLRAQLIDVRSKRVLGVKIVDETEDALSDDAYGGVAAANRALQRVLEQLVHFCVDESASP